MFASRSLKAQATLIELLEDGGLPPICATAVEAGTANELVGTLLAEAVREQRGRKPVSSNSDWRASSLPKDAALDPVEDLLRQQTTERLKEMADDVAAGSIDHWFEDEEAPEGFTVSLDDVLEARARKRTTGGQHEVSNEATIKERETETGQAHTQEEEVSSTAVEHALHGDAENDGAPEKDTPSVEASFVAPTSSQNGLSHREPPVVEAVFSESIREAAAPPAVASPTEEETAALWAQYKTVQDNETEGGYEEADEEPAVEIRDDDAPAVDDAVQSKGDEAEEWLLDAIAGENQASLGDVVAKLGEMGEAARQRAAAQSALQHTEPMCVRGRGWLSSCTL